MKKRTIASLSIILTLSFNLFSQDPGDLDPSFGDQGQFTFHFGTADYFAYDVALQSDGKIVIVGTIEYNTGQDVFVMRLNANGTLDNSFQSLGFSSYEVTDSDFEAARAVKLSGSKILIGGYSTPNGFVMRLNSDGSLDNTFGTNGIRTVSQLNTINDLVTIPGIGSYDIICAGSFPDAAESRPGVVKLSNSGYLSTSFGDDGVATLPATLKGIFSEITGSISSFTVCGTKYPSTGINNDALFARFDLSGNLVTSFGGSGYAIIDGPIAGKSNNATAMVKDFSGVITFGGTTMGTTDDDAYAGRLTASGNIDTNFGDSGFYSSGFEGEDDQINAMVLQADDKIIIGGTSDYYGDNDFNLTRLNPDGTADFYFGNNSWQLTDFSSADDVIEAMAFGEEGNAAYLITVGNSEKGGEKSIAVAKYHAVLPGVGVKDIIDLSTIHLELFPNPVTSDQITLKYHLEASNPISINLCSMDGKILSTFEETKKSPGDYTDTYNIPADYPAGNYLLQFKVGNKTGYKKLIIH